MPVDKLSTVSSTLRRHFWIVLLTFGSVVGAAVAYLSTTTPQYQTAVRLMIDDRKTGVTEFGRAISEVSTATPGGANPIATQAELLLSSRVLSKALDEALPETANTTDEDATAYPSVDELRSTLEIAILPATNLLEVSYVHPDQEFVSNILNAIAQAAVEENAESIRLEASSVREFLEGRIPRQQAQLQELETRESQFRQASGLVAADTQANALVQSLSGVENELRATLVQLQEANTRDGLLRQITGVSSPVGGYAAVRAGQDEGLRELRTRITDVEARIFDSQSRLGDQHPDLLALQDERADLQQYYDERYARTVGGAVPESVAASDDVSSTLIADYIAGDVERNTLASRLTSLQSSRQQLQAQLATLPQQQQQLAALIRQREEEEETLKLLQSTLEQARIAEAQLISNVRVVDPATVPDGPAFPNPPVVIVMAIAAGSILSAGAVLMLDLLDDRVHEDGETTDLFKVPVVGTLPKLESLSGIDHLEAFLDDPAQVEPYRLLLKSLEFRNENPLRAILISSSLPLEGKSNVVARMAAVAAMLSKRTLVIDADLRQPLQHELLDVLPQPGLTEVIEGSIPLYKAIQATRLENLSVLPAGRPLARPLMTLESPFMRKLVTKVASYYDLVIIDTAPAGKSADALTLSEYADGLFLVVRPDYSPRDTVQRTLSDLQNTSGSNLGVILSSTGDPAGKPISSLPEGYRLSSAPALSGAPAGAPYQDD